MRNLLRWIVFLPVSACVSFAENAAPPTTLEHQLVGVYQEIDEDLVYASSVRGRDATRLTSADGLRAAAIQARAMQLFNEDELVELKNAQCVAERKDARLQVRSCAFERNADLSFAARRKRLVHDENKAREGILTWAAHVLAKKRGRSQVDTEELAELRGTYFRLLREVASPLHLFEGQAGDFVEAGE
jgi:hypothetical protein